MNQPFSAEHQVGITRQLHRVLQALAAPAQEQRALFPEFVVLGDELALEFANWYQVLVSNGYDKALSPEGLRVIARIDQLLDGMANTHEHVWSAEGVAESREWADIRAAASEALLALGWSEGDPGSFREGYVRQ